MFKKPIKENRVVITGLGVVSPIGLGLKEFWPNLISGKNGISEITHFDTKDFPSKMAAEVKGFKPENWIDKKSAKRMDRFSHFSIVSSEMAINDAGLNNFIFDQNRAGVIIGSGIGGAEIIEKTCVDLYSKGPKSINPFSISQLIINMSACMISIRFGLKGPLSAPAVACSSGANAIGNAYRILQRGDADIMLAGGSEASITPLAYSAFCATRSMSKRNDCVEKASRPFDKKRDGFVMGEGSGTVVLETLEHAVRRKARVYAELIGYGNTADAYHLTAPEPSGEGMFKAMEKALNDAEIRPQEVGYINAHGTSTILNDKIESAAISKLFGDHSKILKVSAIKSMIGHQMGAAGAVEFISTVMSVNDGILPPTINYEYPDPDCSLDYVTKGSIKKNIDIALTNSFGFGGGNACLVVKKFHQWGVKKHGKNT
jgi:3-oxoacyl-[acyl-carrier-protein] synthase II